MTRPVAPPTPRQMVAAQSYLNYPGDVTDGLAVGQRKGPTTYGGWMYVVSWEYDPKADKARVGMSAINPGATP